MVTVSKDGFENNGSRERLVRRRREWRKQWRKQNLNLGENITAKCDTKVNFVTKEKMILPMDLITFWNLHLDYCMYVTFM